MQFTWFRHGDVTKIKLRFDDIDIDQTGEMDCNDFWTILTKLGPLL